MRPVVRCAVAVCVALAVARPARAEMSSWLYLGVGGAGLSGNRVSSPRVAMQLDTGLGSSPHRAIVVGPGVRMQPYIGDAVDFSSYLRVATQGYVLGHLGAALDGGAYARTGGARSHGFLGTLNVGLPWGVVVSGSYSQGSEDARALTVTLGVDFLRLTVFRTSGEGAWPNVNPAYRPPPAPGSSPAASGSPPAPGTPEAAPAEAPPSGSSAY